jgi:MFS superfamily sulfate permease-like transporter
MILATNLLIGVATGFGLALAHLLIRFARLDVQLVKNGDRYDVHLRGAATFMSLPKLGDALESISDQSEVHIHLDEIACLDRAFAEHIEDWQERHPGRIFLETDRSEERGNPDLIDTQ